MYTSSLRLRWISKVNWRKNISRSGRDHFGEMFHLDCPHTRQGPGVAQWWGHSLPTNLSRVEHVRFPDRASYLGWVCLLVLFALREVFLRIFVFSLFSKTNISNFQFIWSLRAKGFPLATLVKQSRYICVYSIFILQQVMSAMSWTLRNHSLICRITRSTPGNEAVCRQEVTSCLHGLHGFSQPTHTHWINLFPPALHYVIFPRPLQSAEHWGENNKQSRTFLSWFHTC